MTQPIASMDIHGPQVPWGTGPRKIAFNIQTTPTELRCIASFLETAKEVNVNWYHTQISFINENFKAGS